MSLKDTMLAKVLALWVSALRQLKADISGINTHGFVDYLKQELQAEFDRDRHDNSLVAAAQMGGDVVNTMLVIVIAAVVGFVGIKATSETDSSIDVASGSEYDNASNSLTEGFTSAMDLTEVVFIVLMLGVIILALVGLRGR